MKLQDKKFAILVEEVYEDSELWYPFYRLKEEGAEVVLVGPEQGQTYKSKYGYPATADKAASQVKASDFDGIVIPGGYSPDRMRRHRSMVQLVKKAFDEQKIVAAICHAGWMLCSAGVLKGRRVTSFSSIKDDMVNAGADWVDEEVVRDGQLITSRQPKDLPAFMRAIIEACVAMDAPA